MGEERRSRGTDKRGRGHEEDVAVEGECKCDSGVVPVVMVEMSVAIDGAALLLEARFSC